MRELRTGERVLYNVLVDSSAQMAIKAAGGLIERGRCCEQSYCECRHEPDRSCHQALFAGVGLTLNGSRSREPDDKDAGRKRAQFSAMFLYRLPTGTWLKRQGQQDRLDRLMICSVELEISRWMERRQAYARAGGYNQPSDDQLRQAGIGPDSYPAASQLIEYQRAMDEQRNRAIEDELGHHENPGY